MRVFKRLVSLLLCGSLLASHLPNVVLAEELSFQGLCAHHTVHENCGYQIASVGSICSHEHAEDCYAQVTNCIHQHGECSNVEASDEIICEHECTTDNGCIINRLSCNHAHDELCGYAEPKESAACQYICEECKKQEEPVCTDTTDCSPGEHNEGDKKESADDMTVDGTSSAETVVTVDETETVTDVAAGEVQGACELEVIDASQQEETIAVTAVEITAETDCIAPGETLQLTATVLPENATDKKVTWSSQDETVLTVDENGLVTGVAGGCTFAVATAAIDGEVVAQFEISVVNKLAFADRSGVFANQVKNATRQRKSLRELQSDFPDGAYWNHKVTTDSNHGYDDGYNDVGTCNNPNGTTQYRCYSHEPNVTTPAGEYACNSFNGAQQCQGFARKLAYDAMGTLIDEWDTYNRTETNESLINYIKTKLKPGDVIGYYGGDADDKYGHWVFVIGVSDDRKSFTVGECNVAELADDGKTIICRCKIKWGKEIKIDDKITWASVFIAPYELEVFDSEPVPDMTPSQYLSRSDVADEAHEAVAYPKGGSITAWKLPWTNTSDNGVQDDTLRGDTVTEKVTLIRKITNHTGNIWFEYDTGDESKRRFVYSGDIHREYTVTFDGNGGTCTATSVPVRYKGIYAPLPTATRDGYEFTGWYTQKTGGKQVTDYTTVEVESNHTLYAHWSVSDNIFPSIDDPSVFIKQESDNTCTLAASVMMLRRRAILDRNINWNSITENAVKNVAWGTNGLDYSFTYEGMTVNTLGLISNGYDTVTEKKTYFVSLLETKPEGIVVYDHSKPHAVLITDYDVANDVFYCADSALGTGRILLSQSTLNGSGEIAKLENIKQIWRITGNTGSGGTHLPVSVFSFNSGINGSTGSMSSLSVTPGKTFTMPQNGFSYTGFEVVGWNLKRNDGLWLTYDNTFISEEDATTRGYYTFYSGYQYTFEEDWVEGEDCSFTFYPIWQESETDTETEEGLRTELASGKTKIKLEGSVTLDKDLVIPAGTKLTTAAGCTLEIPQGIKLTNNGSISVGEKFASSKSFLKVSGTCESNGDISVLNGGLENSGTLNNNGELRAYGTSNGQAVIFNYGKLSNSGDITISGERDGTLDAQFSGGGTYSQTAQGSFTQEYGCVTGVQAADIQLTAKARNTVEIQELLSAGYKSLQIHVVNDLTLTQNLTIPEGVSFFFEGDTLTIPEGIRMTIDGAYPCELSTESNDTTVNVQGELYCDGDYGWVDMWDGIMNISGKLVVNDCLRQGKLIVLDDGTLINNGRIDNYGQPADLTMSEMAIFMNNGYIAGENEKSNSTDVSVTGTSYSYDGMSDLTPSKAADILEHGGIETDEVFVIWQAGLLRPEDGEEATITVDNYDGTWYLFSYGGNSEGWRLTEICNEPTHDLWCADQWLNNYAVVINRTVTPFCTVFPHSTPTEDNAVLNATWNNPSEFALAKVGFLLGTTPDSFRAYVYEIEPGYETALQIPCSYDLKNECGISLQPGTTYYYRLYLERANEFQYSYFSDIHSFTTAGEPPLTVIDEPELWIQEDMSLTGNTLVAEGTAVYIDEGVTVTVPAGIELNIQGYVEVYGELIFEENSILTITDDYYRRLSVWTGKLDAVGADISGVPYGAIEVQLNSFAVIRGIPDEMLYAATYVYSAEDVNAALEQASKYEYLSLMVDSSFALTNSIAIPDNTDLFIWQWNAEAELPTVTVSAGMTFTNNGELVLDSGRFVVEQGAKLVNNNYIAVSPNATMLVYGELQQNGEFNGVYQEIGLQALSKPEVKALSDTETGGGILTWKEIDGADSYDVYCATSSGGQYSKIATVETVKTTVSVPAGKTYYYKIKAICEADASLNSAYSSVVKVTGKCARPVVTVTSNTASGKPVIKWAAIDGAAKYEVYRSTTKSGTYTRISTTTGTSVTNTKTETGKLYYYKVRALHADSSANSAYSAVVSRTCDLPRPVVTVSNVASSGKPKLSWEAIEGAVKYEVYRATSKDGTYSLLKTTTGTSLTNTSTTAGTTYYYKVKALHSSSSANSAYSSVVSRTCDLPRPVVKVSNVASSGKLKLTWGEVEGAVKYEVYRATSKDGTYSLLKTTTGTSLTNTSTTAGTTYYYKVKALHSSSSANSAYSSVVSRTCDLPRPTLKVTLNSSGNPKLSWTKIDGATKYEVYRATSKDGSYTLLKTTTGTSLTNTSVTAGTTYYYKVRAIHSNSGANSTYSAVKSVTAK